VSIGGTLAHARQQAGLTIAEVSQRTRIRERLIQGIEDDDFSVCGGDFYARGDIRSIAKVVGIDPGPLVEEYDRDWREPDPAAGEVQRLVSASGATAPGRAEPPPGGPGPRLRQTGALPPRPVIPPRRPRRNWVLALAAAAVVALGAACCFSNSGEGAHRGGEWKSEQASDDQHQD
jgi:transcriptional regulator with XRE-family HTH domain